MSGWKRGAVMSGIKHIFGKEMARVFKDRKMIFSVFVLPVVVMIGIMEIGRAHV